ncbi:YitT family protein [Chakrabartyella piscis]|uniref:YitT family protein n=1 Tax=Chakrabartyella piscis TaxID=2918914 RepID=UPI002958426B|nr:YitT family protein [Chakrabartyella piscis]
METKGIFTKKDCKRLALVVVASFMIALNIKSFVGAGGLIPGGFTGITLLIQEIGATFFDVAIPFSPINLALNAGPVFVCYKLIGKKFTIYSCIAIVLTSIFTDILPSYPVTYDILLISIFGGIITGTACSICLRAETTAGGTDFVAIFMSEKYGLDAYNYILMGNAVVLIIAGSIFGWDKALYSIIYQFTTTQAIHVCYKRYKKNTFLVVTDYPELVAQAISECTHHGATMFTGVGTYSQRERTLVYSIVNSDQVKATTAMIKAADPKAFINVVKTENLEGNFYNRPKD